MTSTYPVLVKDCVDFSDAPKAEIACYKWTEGPQTMGKLADFAFLRSAFFVWFTILPSQWPARQTLWKAI